MLGDDVFGCLPPGKLMPAQAGDTDRLLGRPGNVGGDNGPITGGNAVPCHWRNSAQRGPMLLAGDNGFGAGASGGDITSNTVQGGQLKQQTDSASGAARPSLSNSFMTHSAGSLAFGSARLATAVGVIAGLDGKLQQVDSPQTLFTPRSTCSWPACWASRR
jgi:hypothetical protein